MGGRSAAGPVRTLIDRAKVNAYAAAIAAGARMQGAYKPMAPEVEFAKPPVTKNPLYNDSHYFNFFDHEHKIGGFTRIGKLANQNASLGMFYIFDRQDCALVLLQSEHIPRDLKELRSSCMRYEIIEPLKELRIVATGKFLRLEDPSELSDPMACARRVEDKDFVSVDVDITFKAWAEIHNSKRFYARGLADRMVEKGFGLRDLMEARKFAAEHYEQVGSYSGSIRIGSRAIDLKNASGHRDHSWGPRDMSGIKGWTWLTAQFGHEAAVNVAWFNAGNLDILSGFLCRNGHNYPCRVHHLDTEFEDDGITQKTIRFAVEDTSGFRMEIKGRVLNPVPIVLADDDQNHTIAFEAMTEYEWQGRTGYGISEYVHKLR